MFKFLSIISILMEPSAMTDEAKNDDMLAKLDPLQYHVTQEGGTERPFQNKYWDNKKEGIYVDVVSGEALFSSKDKFDSGTGWPSFSKPIDDAEIIKKEDSSMGMSRIEVRSEKAHLGHLFFDGPKEAGGNRFCINSASLKFISKDKLAEEGYEQYSAQFAE